MIDHIGLSASDPAASKSFYERALRPLGYEVLADLGDVFGLGGPVPGIPGKVPDLWLAPGGASPVHVSFTATSTDQVDAFHEQALAAGGRDNGAPGPRPEYGPGYYAAYALDPDGNNVEAVCHLPAAPRA